MPNVELSAGPIAYDDTGGDGPTVVLVHGLLMDGTVWRDVVPRLAPAHRVVVPTLPLGAHRTAMRPDADLTGPGQARLLAELLAALDLQDVTLVGNDWGGVQLVAADGPHDRVGRVVLTSQEAFDNYPPGLPGTLVGLVAKVPGGLFLAVQQLRLPFARHTPTTFGPLTRRGIPGDLVDGWIEGPRHDRGVRRDLARYARATTKGDYERTAERLRGWTKPALVAWGREDRLMPPAHAERLAALLPDSRLVWIEESSTLLSIDNPAATAEAIAAFVAETAGTPSPTG